MCRDMHVYIRTYLHIHIYRYGEIHVYTCHMSAHITYMCITCIYTYMCVYIYIHVEFIYMYTSLQIYETLPEEYQNPLHVV